MDTDTSVQAHAQPLRHRRWLPWLVVVALTAAMVAGLAWFAYQQRAALIINATNAALLPYGLHVQTLDGLQLSTTSLRISRLDLIHSGSGAPQHLSKLRVEFTAAGLLRRRVETISITSAELTLPDLLTNTANDGASSSVTPLAAAGNGVRLGDILPAVPFKQLRIAQLQVTGDKIAAGATVIESLSADLRSLRVDCQHSRCQLTGMLGVSADKLIYTIGQTVINLNLVALDTPIDITLDANTDTVSLNARAASVTLPSIRAGDSMTGLVGNVQRLTIVYALKALDFDPAGLYLHAELSVSEMYTNLVDINLWSMRVDQQLTWQDGIAHIVGAVIRDNQPLLINDLRHSTALESGQGTLVVARTQFNDTTNKLSELLSPLTWRGDILAGSAGASANLNWLTGQSNKPIVTGNVQVSLDELSGYINETAFLQLSTDFTAELLPDWHLRSAHTAFVSLASLDAGIEINNIRSDYRVDSGTGDGTGSISLTDASLELFGGTVSSKQLDYHLQNNDSNFTIDIDSIDLNQMLAISAYKGVSATGLVSGRLPVRLHGLTPSISGGTLTALQPGGTISYGTGATGDGNQSLDLVYQALQDYRFNLMETKVDYQESGELDLAIRMEGISPELNGGQRINLNLNINDDIPALLQSLQAARSVTDSIESRLDARQRSTTDSVP